MNGKFQHLPSVSKLGFSMRQVAPVAPSRHGDA